MPTTERNCIQIGFRCSVSGRGVPDAAAPWFLARLAASLARLIAFLTRFATFAIALLARLAIALLLPAFPILAALWSWSFPSARLGGLASGSETCSSTTASSAGLGSAWETPLRPGCRLTEICFAVQILEGTSSLCWPNRVPYPCGRGNTRRSPRRSFRRFLPALPTGPAGRVVLRKSERTCFWLTTRCSSGWTLLAVDNHCFDAAQNR